MSLNSKRLDDQEQALDSFFDALLRDVEAYAEQETASEPTQSKVFDAPTETEHVESQTKTEAGGEIPAADIRDDASPEQSIKSPASVPATLLAEKVPSPSIFEQMPALEPASTVVESVESPVVEVPPATPEIAAEIQPAPEPEPELEPEPRADEGKPPWAEAEFQAMLFNVAGLTLAVPLMDLNGVIEWDNDRVTEMPGHADFYLGLMTHLGKNIPLVDTAKLVLPPEKLQLLTGDDPLARLTRIVLINDSAYGLACDEVNEVITLQPEDVRWRTGRTQRRWLAGTVIEHMCALIDASAFASLLSTRASVAAFRD